MKALFICIFFAVSITNSLIAQFVPTSGQIPHLDRFSFYNLVNSSPWLLQSDIWSQSVGRSSLSKALGLSANYQKTNSRWNLNIAQKVSFVNVVRVLNEFQSLSSFSLHLNHHDGVSSGISLINNYNLSYISSDFTTGSQWTDQGYQQGMDNGEVFENLKSSHFNTLIGLSQYGLKGFSWGLYILVAAPKPYVPHKYFLRYDRKLSQHQWGLNLYSQNTHDLLANTLQSYYRRFIMDSQSNWIELQLSTSRRYLAAGLALSNNNWIISYQVKRPLIDMNHNTRFSQLKFTYTPKSYSMKNQHNHQGNHLTEGKANPFILKSQEFHYSIEVYFKRNEYELSEKDKSMLKYEVQLLETDRELSIIVEGHSDHMGGEDAKEDIAKTRALSIKNWLISQGIAPERIHTLWVSDNKPKIPVDHDAVSLLNRRVKVTVFK